MGSEEDADGRFNEFESHHNDIEFENENLVYGRWEDDVIWEVTDAVIEECLKPKVTNYNATDEDNVVFAEPEEKAACVSPNASSARDQQVPSKTKNSKRSKILPKTSPTKPDPVPQGAQKTQPGKDPYNISNDEFYEFMGGKEHTPTTWDLKHSLPAMELLEPFIPTHLDDEKLQNFHRPRCNFGVGEQPVLSLVKFMENRAHVRKQEMEKLHQQGHFNEEECYFTKPLDLTGREGELILIENCEEYPPLLSQVGMCSKIENYCRWNSSLQQKETPYTLRHVYGDIVPSRRSPFLGDLQKGKLLSAIRNNLYRSPIYPHTKKNSDFLLIKSKTLSIRDFDAIFTAGQQCPLYEVPTPNSTRVRHFLRDFVRVYTCRKFMASPGGSQQRVRLDSILNAFPTTSEPAIRKWLSYCAEIKKVGIDSWVVKKQDFSIPDEQELRVMVTPEQCCAYFSLLAGEQRLKDLGCYGEKCLLYAAEDDDDEREKLDDEVKCAPWNTTTAFVQASKGRCFLQVSGPADPTGRDLGFSYVRVQKKIVQPQSSEQDVLAKAKKFVTGTDADLRRLSVTNAKSFLRKFGLREEEIKKLPRWEIINLVRTISTEKEKAGVSEKGMTKFSRYSNKMSTAKNQERYKQECQHVFDLQNKLLSSKEVLSTDDDSDSDDSFSQQSREDDYPNLEDMTKKIEEMINTDRIGNFDFDEEENERLELQKMMLGGDRKEKEAEAIAEPAKPATIVPSDDIKSKLDDVVSRVTNNRGCKLVINRKFKTDTGKEYTRPEVVAKPEVIVAYLRIRMTKNEAFVRAFVEKIETEEKMGILRQRRKIKEQLNKTSKLQAVKVEKMVKRMKEDIDTEFFPNLEEKKKAAKSISQIRRRCGACGNFGHVRTSEQCPLFKSDALLRTKAKRRRLTIKPINNGDIALDSEGNELQKVVTEIGKDGDDGDSSSDSSDSSTDNSESDTSGDSDSEDESSASVASEERAMVRVEGTKLILKVPHDMVAQAEQEALEELGIFRRPPKRRIEQNERENADYFRKRYKTTASDRLARLPS